MDETAGLFLVDVLEIDSARLVPGRSDEVCAHATPTQERITAGEQVRGGQDEARRYMPRLWSGLSGADCAAGRSQVVRKAEKDDPGHFRAMGSERGTMGGRGNAMQIRRGGRKWNLRNRPCGTAGVKGGSDAAISPSWGKGPGRGGFWPVREPERACCKGLGRGGKTEPSEVLFPEGGS